MSDEKALGGLLGPNPLAAYMHGQSKDYDANALFAWLMRNGLAGASGIASLAGYPETADRRWQDTLSAHEMLRRNHGLARQTARGAQMWNNTGMPGRPQGY